MKILLNYSKKYYKNSYFYFKNFYFLFISSFLKKGNKMLTKKKNNYIDGKKIAENIQLEIKKETEQLLKEKGIIPGLAVVMVGDRKDSETYVRQKKLAAEKCGFNFFLKKESENIKKEELLKIIDEFNENKEVHGLIIQLPLPKHIDEKEILDKVSYEKDVDGFHLLNIGSFYILQ